MNNTRSFVIREYGAFTPDEAGGFDLSKVKLQQCLGCWACWLKTPGRCVHSDLDGFYRNYLAADEVTFYCKAVQGFVSSNMKAMLDRMIPFVLPYISWDTGESLHDPRYSKYPAWKVVYSGDFLPGEEDAFIAYWQRTAYMMFAPSFTARRCEDENADH